MYKNYVSMLVVALVFGCFANILNFQPAKAEGPVFVDVKANKTIVNKYELFELTIDLNADFDNPFRPETTSDTYPNTTEVELASQAFTGFGISLDATILSETNTFSVPGFWDIDYDYRGTDSRNNDFLAATSGSHWHVRFTPKEPGNYIYSLSVTDKTGTTRYPESGYEKFSVTNTVNPLTPKGFLTKGDDGYLKYDSGEAFTQFGLHSPPSGIGFVNEWFPKLAQNGGNFVRHWLTNNAPQDIFRRNLVKWTELEKDCTVARTVENPGNCSSKDTFVNAAPGTTLVDQSFIGAKADTHYKAFAYVKTDSSFSGNVIMNVTDDTGEDWKSSPVGGSDKNWEIIEVSFRTSSNTKALHIKPSVSLRANGTVWIDDIVLIETDAAGNQQYDFNQVWNPSFEHWDPSQLNLLNLWKFDYLIKKAEENGLVVDVAIFDYREWEGRSDQNSTWARFFGFCPDFCPKDALGKPIVYREFWTDEATKKQTKSVLRYLIARYGYSPSLGLWELTNEMDPELADDSMVRLNWVKEMAGYIKENDPHRHLVTNSYWHSPGDYRYEQLPEIDVSSVHNYVNDESREHKDNWLDNEQNSCDTRSINPDEFIWAVENTKQIEGVYKTYDPFRKQPWISGEFGLMGDEEFYQEDPDPNDDIVPYPYQCRRGLLSHWAFPNDTSPYAKPRHDTTGIFFHNSLWAVLMSNGFKSGVNNWWSEPFFAWNYQDHYKAPSAFSNLIPFRDANSELLSTYPEYASGTGLMTSSNNNIRALGRRTSGNRAYLWIQNKNNTWANVVKDNLPITDESGSIIVHGYNPGEYNVKYYDTMSGQQIDLQTIYSVDGSITIPVILGTSFTTPNKPDVAIIITNSVSVTASASKDTVAQGEIFSYLINVKNETEFDYTGTLTHPLETSRLEFVSASDGGQLLNSIVTWDIINIPAGQSYTYTIRVRAKVIEFNPYIHLTSGTNYFEAEDRRVVVNLFRPGYDPAASGSIYLVVPNGTDAGRQGFAEYKLDASAAQGVYRVFVRTYWPNDSGSNSLFVQMDHGTKYTLGNDANYENWRWIELRDTGGQPVTFSLNNQHTLRIWDREDGSQFDRILLTSDPNFRPQN